MIRMFISIYWLVHTRQEPGPLLRELGLKGQDDSDFFEIDMKSHALVLFLFSLTFMNETSSKLKCFRKHEKTETMNGMKIYRRGFPQKTSV